MDTQLIHVALTIIAIVFVYAVLTRGLLNATEPLRAKCLDLYKKISKSNRADEHAIACMDSYLDELYSSWSAWKLAFLAAYAILFVLPIRRLRGRDSSSENYKGIADSLQSDFSQFMSYWMLATVSNSPAAALLFVLVMLVGVVFVTPFRLIAAITSSQPHHRHAH